MGYLYLRDYRLNSNEWFLNKFSTGAGAENKPKNKFALSRASTSAARC